MLEFINIMVFAFAGITSELDAPVSAQAAVQVSLIVPQGETIVVPQGESLVIAPKPKKASEPAVQAAPKSNSVKITPAFKSFYAAMVECAAFTVSKDFSVFAAGPNKAARVQTGDPSSLTVAYPKMPPEADVFISVQFDAGNSLVAPSYQCSGTGPQSPIWPVFTLAEYPAVKATLNAIGMQEVEFPAGPKMFANCAAEVPDSYVIFNAGEGDRVVFAAVVGEEAKTFCDLYGVVTP